MIKVLFVCLGNICRSPMAEAIFRKMAADAGLSGQIDVASCGTSGWNVGSPPHHGTMSVLRRYGISPGDMRGSALQCAHLDFDYIIAMDEQNLSDIMKFRKSSDASGLSRKGSAEIRLISDYVNSAGSARGAWISVPDPWITGDFEQTYELLNEGCRVLLEYIVKKHGLSLNFNN